MKRRDAFQLIIALFVVAMVVHGWWRPGLVIEGGDNFFGFAPSNELLKSAPPWSRFGVFLGGPTSSGTWIPWLATAGALNSAFGTSVAQACLLFAILYLWFAGMYLYLRSIRVAPSASVLAAALYALNPWTQLFVGINYPLNVAIGMVPLYGAIFVMGEVRSRRPLALLLSGFLSMTMLATIGANPALILLFAGGVALLGSIAVASNSASERQWWLKFSIVNTLAAAWWLFLVANYFLGAKIVASGTQEFIFVVSRASLLNVLRFNAFWGWAHPEYFSYAAAYDRNPLSYLASFLLAFSAFAAVMLLGETRRRAGLIGLSAFICGAFLSKGLHPPLAQLNALFYRLPATALFREPTTKFQLIALLAGVVVFAFVVERVLSLASHRTRRAAVAALAVPIVIAAAPMLRGEQFGTETPKYHSESPAMPSHYVSLPTEWRDIARVLAAAPRGAVITYPFDQYYQVNYRWGYYGADVLPIWLLSDDVFALGLAGYTSSDVVQDVTRWISDATLARSPLLPRVLRSIGVRYVIYRNDVIPPLDSQPAPTEVDVSAVFSTAQQRRFGDLTLYDLGPSAPDIAVADRWVATNRFASNPVREIELRALTGSPPSVEMQSPAGPLAAAINRNLAAPMLPIAAASLAAVPMRFVAFDDEVSASNVEAVANDSKASAWNAVAPDQDQAQVLLHYDDLDGRDLGAGTQQVQVLSSQSEDEETLNLIVLNPVAQQTRRDIIVSLLTDADSTYLMTAATAVESGLLQSRHGNVGVFRFPSVPLQPGLNEIGLKRVKATATRDTGVEGGDDSEVGMANIPHSEIQGAPWCARPLCRQFIGRLNLEARVRDIVRVSLDSHRPQPSTLLGRFDMRDGSRRFSCWAEISAGGVSTSPLFLNCGSNHGGSRTFLSAILEGIELFRMTPSAPADNDAIFDDIRVSYFGTHIPISMTSSDGRPVSSLPSTALAQRFDPSMHAETMQPGDDVVVDLAHTRMFPWSTPRSIRGTLVATSPSQIVLRVGTSPVVIPMSSVEDMAPGETERIAVRIALSAPRLLRPFVLHARGADLGDASAVLDCSGFRLQRKLEATSPYQYAAYFPAADRDCKSVPHVDILGTVVLDRVHGEELAFEERSIGSVDTPPTIGVPRQSEYSTLWVNPAGAEDLRTDIRGTQRLLTLNLAFSRSWIVLQPSLNPVRPHMLVDGWRNGWIIDARQPYLIIQLSLVVELLLAVAGFIGIIRSAVPSK